MDPYAAAFNFDLNETAQSQLLYKQQDALHSSKSETLNYMVCFGHLLQLIAPRISKDKAKQLQYLYSKAKKNKIDIHYFIRRMRSMVGRQMIKEAMLKTRVRRRTVQGCNKGSQVRQLVQRSGEKERPAAINRKIEDQAVDRVLPHGTKDKQVRISDLLPLILPHLGKDKAMQLRTLSSKLGNNEIQKHDFTRRMKEIVGDARIFKQAITKIQNQQQQDSHVWQVPLLRRKIKTQPVSSPNIQKYGLQKPTSQLTTQTTLQHREKSRSGKIDPGNRAPPSSPITMPAQFDFMGAERKASRNWEAECRRTYY